MSSQKRPETWLKGVSSESRETAYRERTSGAVQGANQVDSKAVTTQLLSMNRHSQNPMLSAQRCQLLRLYHRAEDGHCQCILHQNRDRERSHQMKMAFGRHTLGDHNADEHHANECVGDRHVLPTQQSATPHANEAQRTSSGSLAKEVSRLRKRFGSLFRKQVKIVKVNTERYVATLLQSIAVCKKLQLHPPSIYIPMLIIDR